MNRIYWHDPLGTRIYNCLMRRYGRYTEHYIPRQLPSAEFFSNITDEELLSIPRLGAKSLERIRTALREFDE